MLIVVAAAVAIASLPLPSDSGPSWAEFSMHPELRRVTTTVAVGTLTRTPGEPFRYWLRRVAYRDGDRLAVSTDWIDSAACPAVQPVLAKMASVSAPVSAPYGFPAAQRDVIIMLDGTTYALSAPALYPSGASGTITVTSNIGTPLAAWDESSMRALATCWSNRMPR